MKKVTILSFLVFLFSTTHAQMEVGYNTTDIGAEFQWYQDGKFIGLHLAVNSKLHHSFHGEIGYYMAGDPTSSFYINTTNGGLGTGLGYRYYTNLRPHAFFIGAKANFFTYKIGTQTLVVYNSKIIVPSLETGYMVLINDMFFITPTVAAGYKMNLNSAVKKIEENKAVALVGVSAGFKF